MTGQITAPKAKKRRFGRVTRKGEYAMIAEQVAVAVRSTGKPAGNALDVPPEADAGNRMRAVNGARNPVGDVTDQEIREWKFSYVPGIRFAGYIAERVGEGAYDGGKEVCANRPWILKEIPKEDFENAMNMLVERNVLKRVKTSIGGQAKDAYYAARDRSKWIGTSEY